MLGAGYEDPWWETGFRVENGLTFGQVKIGTDGITQISYNKGFGLNEGASCDRLIIYPHNEGQPGFISIQKELGSSCEDGDQLGGPRTTVPEPECNNSKIVKIEVSETGFDPLTEISVPMREVIQFWNFTNSKTDELGLEFGLSPEAN